MNNEKLKARDFFHSLKYDEQIDKAMSGQLMRWELPSYLQRRAEQLTQIVNFAIKDINVLSPELVRLIDTSGSDISDELWYEWSFTLQDDRTSMGRGFYIDIREGSPKVLACFIQKYAENLLDLSAEIELMNW